MSNATLEGQKVLIPAKDLLDLIIGASTVADKNAPTQLTGLELSAKANTFTVRATDRYRLIVGTTKAIREITASDTGDLAPISLSWADTKQLITYLKSEKIAGILISRAGDEITFRGMSGSLTLQNWGMLNLPDFSHILAKVSGEPSPMASVKLSADLLAGLAKVPHDDTKGMIFSFYGEKSPVKVSLSHELIEWDVLIMPMRNA